MRRARVAFLGVALLFAGPVLAGQTSVTDPVAAIEVAPLGAGEFYGTSSLSAVTLTAFHCSTYDQADTWQPVLGSPNRFITAGVFECAFQAPAGSLLIAIEIEGCDTSATGEISASLYKTTSPGGAGASVAAVGTGVAATPGCARFPLTLPTPELVDNQNNKYWFEVATENTPFTRLGGVRVYYRLQVSPAPATATFGDVPVGSPQHRFVEALVAAGITGGCGAGLYCPDAALTRGQMAVFLSVALGLHWPN